MRYITLNKKIDALEQFNKNCTDNTLRYRSQCLLLLHKERTIIDLASIFDLNRRTIKRWFDSWSKTDVDSLPIPTGRGVKTRLKGYEKEVTQQFELHSRNLKKALTYFKEEHNILICEKTLQNF